MAARQILLLLLCTTLFAAAGCLGPGDPLVEASEDALGQRRQCASHGSDPIDPASLPVQGFDVSMHQPSVDWTAVATTGMTFAIARVSDGLYTIDGQKFQDHFAGTAEAGLIRGAYQFLRPEQDAHEQAAVYLDALEAGGGLRETDLPPILDVEVETARRTGERISTAQIQQHVRAWIDDVEAVTRRHVIVYTLAGVTGSLGTGFSEHVLWVANFYQQCPRMPDGWDDWDFFQYTDRGRVAGIRQDTDLDVYNGSLEELEQLIADSHFPPQEEELPPPTPEE